jgi:hypothetical protein
MPRRPPIWTGPSRCRHRNATIRRTTGGGVRAGEVWGRLERSRIPTSPSARHRAAHFRAVTVETMNIFAASDGVQPSSTTNRANRARARGVKAALAWDTKASWP